MVRRQPVRRDAIVDALSQQRRALHVRELAARLGLEDHQRELLRDALEELVAWGVVAPLSGQRYRLIRAAAEPRGRLVEGVLHVNPRGFGFVRGTDSSVDLYVHATSFRGAMHGDTVRARVVSRSSRGLDGEVLEVLLRGRRRVVGTLRRRRASCWLEPDDERIRGPIVLPRVTGRARTGRDGPRARELEPTDGLAAVVELTRFPAQAQENPEGRLVAVLGRPGDPAVEVRKILLEHGVEDAHPPAADDEAAALGQRVERAALVGREDLTDIPFVTIDPADARDHDDAVWVERLGDGGYRAWIAVADVSHYVRPGSALDDAARSRGHSVYLPDRAIPMLPAALSAGLCSLLPDTDRLCLCFEIDVRANGAVKRSRLLAGVMRSRAKLSYGGVARALGFTLEGPRCREADELRHELSVMWDLAVRLRRRRMRRGALDLDVPETRVTVDAASGEPTAVERRGHDPGVRKAYRLIEELMLLANETCARYLIERELPTVFRVHAKPDPDKLDRFAALVAELGLSLPAETVVDATADPKLLTDFLRSVADHPKATLLHGLLLRAMQQAGYDTVNIGHYGLASGAYVHFSSPIRRYPDLLVHRVLHAARRGEPVSEAEVAPPGEPVAVDGPGSVAEPESPLRAAAIHCSEREREIMAVERDVVDLYRALYMRAFIGDRFEGIVSAITAGALFVRLEAPFVDVLITLDALGPDAYEPDELGLRVVGARSGDTIELGDAMQVVIEDVSLVRRAVYGRRIVGPARQRGSRRRREATRDRAKGRGSKRRSERTTGQRRGRSKPRGRGRGRRR